MSKRLDKTAILADLSKTFGQTVTRAQVLQYEQDHGMNRWSVTRWYRTMSTKVSRGVYRLPNPRTTSPAPVSAVDTSDAASV